ncbi:unnamed protein product, partial [Sphacelaria rigidula]
RRKGLRSIRDEPALGKLISEYLPEARDRSHLADLNPTDGMSFVNPRNREVICLPTENTFRTNPDKGTGCGPFASKNAWNCCEQTDTEFCAKVAAVMEQGRDKFDVRYGLTHRIFNNGRIVREIRDWMKTHNIPLSTEVSLDTAKDDDMKILKLAVFVRTSVTINNTVNQPSENLDESMSNLRSIIHVRAPEGGDNTGATVSFVSFRRIAQDFGKRRKLVIHCPVDMTGFGADNVVAMISGARFTTLNTFEYEFPLPLTIPVKSLGPLLIASYPGWVDRPRRHDGPIFDNNHERVEVNYDLTRNRICV